MELNEVNKKEKCVCSESIQNKRTIEEELHWAKGRIEELINERNSLLDRFNREENQKKVLIHCLSEEHGQRVREYNQTEWYCRRTEAYRDAVNDISEVCRKILELENKKTPKSVKQLIKEIQSIISRF